MSKEGALRLKMKYSRMRGKQRKATIGTAHAVIVNSRIELNKQTNKQTNIRLSGLRASSVFYIHQVHVHVEMYD
jgi:hypothetical protein